MNRTRLSLAGLAVLIAAAIAVVLTTSGGTAKTSAATIAPGSALTLKYTTLGSTLADANGRTLYLFEGDKPGVSRLSPAGRAIWPPFTVNTKPRALSGVAAAAIGTIQTSGAGFQVTYNGHPLYYYVGDHASGQTLGQGLNQFGALWYVLDGGGSAITSAPTSAPTSPGSSPY